MVIKTWNAWLNKSTIQITNVPFTSASVSEWKHEEVNTATLKAADQCLRVQKRLSGKPTGLIFDETSHLKKGDKSVGVKRQYTGVCGKVDNCEVSVHTSLCNERFCTLVGTSLFLPQEWAEDSVRCIAAGIPKDHQVHKTKPELALALVKDAIAQGVEFDFVGGDGLYGGMGKKRKHKREHW